MPGQWRSPWSALTVYQQSAWCGALPYTLSLNPDVPAHGTFGRAPGAALAPGCATELSTQL